MDRVVRILLFVFFIAGCGNVSAQFNISRTETSNLAAIGKKDSLIFSPKSTLPFNNEFFNKAFWKNERKARRKERNTIELNTTLQVAQTRFDNWGPGGDNTFSARSTVYFKHRFHVKKFNFESRFEARYGLNYIEKKRFKNEDEFKLHFNSSWDISSKWSYSAVTNLRSQFSTSYKGRDDNTRVSTLMAPGFLDMAIGFKYSNKPFTCQLSPVGGNAVFVLDSRLREKGMHGVDPGEKSKWTVGPSIKLNLDWEFYKKIFWLRSEAYSFTNTKKTPTVRWETNLEIRATKFLTTTLYGLMYYDKESNAEKPHSPQYTSVISVGLKYTFKNK